MKKYSSDWKIFFGVACVLFLVLIYLFMVLAKGISQQKVFVFDQKLIGWTERIMHPVLTILVKGITEAGDVWWLSIGTLLVSFYWLYRKQYGNLLLVTVGMVGASLMIPALKNTYERVRPDENPLVYASGYSFPSGHSMGSIIFYGLLLYFVLKSGLRPRIKGIVGTGLCLMVLLIGWSRIYLGVHYPTDIVAGFIAGTIWITLCMAFREVFLVWGSRRKQHES